MINEIITRKNPMQITSSFEVHDSGMNIVGVPTLAEYIHLASLLGQVKGALSWAVGDFLNSFEMHHGEMVAQTEAMFPDKSYQYLMDCKWVSSRVSQTRRHQGSFSAWKEVLVLDHIDQDKLLKEYSDGVLHNQKALRSAVREKQGTETLRTIVTNTFMSSVIKKLEKFLVATDTLSLVQEKILGEAIALLREI